MPLTGELVPVAGEGGVQGKPADEGVEAAKKTARR
jgi:hypothetical protein